MFKTKWQRKYEQAMKSIESWRDFYRKQINRHPECTHMNEIYRAQACVLSDTLRDMQNIAKNKTL